MAKLLDIPRKALIGSNLTDLLYHPQLKTATKRIVLRIYKEMFYRRSRYLEFQDASGRHLLVTVTYGDQLEGDYLFSVKDVTEFKQIEQSAYQNDKLAMLGKIAASIAHEIAIRSLPYEASFNCSDLICFNLVKKNIPGLS